MSVSKEERVRRDSSCCRIRRRRGPAVSLHQADCPFRSPFPRPFRNRSVPFAAWVEKAFASSTPPDDPIRQTCETTTPHRRPTLLEVYIRRVMLFRHHQPLTSTYDDTRRLGMSFYSPSVSDVEKKYRTTLSKTSLRSDRGDLGLYSFAGSNLHGGTPAADRGSMPKTSGSSRPLNQNLYDPIDTSGYGRGYYDHLRATSPEPRTKTRTSVLDEPIFDYEVPKTTVTKTTRTTEHWVPLTTHIYSSPYHTYYYNASPYSSHTYRTADDLYSYNYVDDFKRYSSKTTTTRSKNLDALDLSITSKNYDRMDYGRTFEKCRELQSQLGEVSACVSEAESRLKSEVSAQRATLAADLAEVSLVVDDTAKYNDDLHRVIRQQAKKIAALTSQYEDINQSIADVSETLEKSRVRCQGMQSEFTTMATSLQLAAQRR